jgi:hypothetical protein
VQWGGVLPNMRVKPHFNVNNSYVIRKLRIVLFPWIHKQWGRKSHRTDAGVTEYQPPRDDVNSPDLYIPRPSNPLFEKLLFLIAAQSCRW